MNKLYFTLYCALLTAAAGLAAAAGYAVGKHEAEQAAQAQLKEHMREWRAQLREELMDYADRVISLDEDEPEEERAEAPGSPSAWDERDGEGL